MSKSAAVAHLPTVNTSGIDPIEYKVVVRPEKAIEKTKGGIVLPDIAKDKPMAATVIAVGEGRLDSNGTLHPIPLEAGARVLVGKYTGVEVNYDETSYLIASPDEVLAVILEEAD